MRSVFVHGKTWFDKVNGNSYFSARVYVDGEEVLRLPFQYGYGSQYLHVAHQYLKAAALLPEDSRNGLGGALSDLGADFYWTLEQSRKRDVIAWGRSE